MGVLAHFFDLFSFIHLPLALLQCIQPAKTHTQFHVIPPIVFVSVFQAELAAALKRIKLLESCLAAAGVPVPPAEGSETKAAAAN